MTSALEPRGAEHRNSRRGLPAAGRAAAIVIAAALSLGSLSLPARAGTGTAVDGATATGPDAVVVGKSIRVSGTGWIAPDAAGGGGSVIGVKLDDSVLTPKTPPVNPVDSQPNTRVWAVVQAKADGSWQVDLPFPTTANTAPASGFVAENWVAGTTHNVRLLTGSLKPNDTIRSVSLPFTVTLPSLTGSTPKISGTAKVGKTLTAKPGSWTKGTTLTYQWLAGGVVIDGQTGKTLKLAAEQKGTTIKVKVTGSKAGYATVAKTSKATKKVK